MSLKDDQATTSTPSLEPKVFKKRVGTTDVGKDYENMFMANLVLNLIEDDTIENFNLWSNYDSFGYFDDVILDTQSSDYSKNKKLAFQLKHVIDDKNLALEALKEEKDNFTLKKYFEAFQNHKEALSDHDLILLTYRQFTPDSNTKLDLDKVQVKIVEAKLNPLVNSKNEPAKCYKFEIISEDDNENFSNIPEDYKIFFERFYIYANQVNVNNLKTEIHNRLKNKFSCKEEVSEKFLNFFTNWNLLDKSKEALQKPMIKQLIALYLVSANMRPITFGNITENRKILQTAVSKFHVSVFDQTLIQKGQSVWVASKDNIDIKEVNIVNKNYQITNHGISDITNLTEEEWSKLLWIMGECPLIVEESPTVYETFKLCNDRNFILLTDEVHKTKMDNYSVFHKLSDLKSEDLIFKNTLSNFKCLLPQRETNLAELVKNTDVSDTITTNELLRMVEADYKFEQTYEDVPIPYIPRQLSRHIIKSEYLDNMEKDSLILISNVSSQQKQQFIQKYDALSVAEYLKNPENNIQRCQKGIIFISEEDCSVKTFHAICKKNNARKVFHQFTIFKNDLEWIQSYGNIVNLRQYYLRGGGFLEEEELVEVNNENKIHLIIGEPGLGKSWLLKSLKNKLSSKAVAIIFTPKDVEKICEFIKQNGIIFDKLCDYIFELKYSDFKQLDHCVMMSFFMNYEVIYLWDALDEIVSSKNRTTIIEVIHNFSNKGIVQWITSRQHLKNDLESKFCVLSRTLHELNISQQKEYIQKRLKSVCPNQEDSHNKLTENIIQNITFFKHKDIVSIPLQIYMLTEICRDAKNRSHLMKGIFSLANLYEYFVDEKFNFCYNKLSIVDESHLERFKQEKTALIKRLEKAALKTILGEDFLKALNLDTDDIVEDVQRLDDLFGFVTEFKEGDIRFAHISYAEFFVASYLAQRKLAKMKVFIFDVKYTNIRYFFDLILAKNCPAHLAVLYNNLSELEKCKTEEINSKDGGGRNPLQLACSWGPQWQTLPFQNFENNFYLTSSYQHTEKNPSMYLPLIDRLIMECNIWDKDIFFKMNTLQYAECNASLWALAAIESKHGINYFNTQNYQVKCTILYNAVTFNIPHFILLFPEYVNCLKTEKLSTYPLLLQLACDNNHERVLKILITAGIDINITNKQGVTPFMNACKNGLEKVVEMLITVRDDINAADRTGLTPLIYACMYGYEEVVEILIRLRVEVDIAATNKQGNTPLMYACRKGHEKVVEMLIVAGVNINAANKQSDTPLIYACRYGFEKVVDMLIKAKVDINAANNYRVTPLMYACKNRLEKVVRMLITSGVDINAADKDGVTALVYACRDGCEKVVEMLITARSDIHLADKQGATPLTNACYYGQEKVVEMLISVGVDINNADEQGVTPLMYACTSGCEKVVEILITAGVSIHATDNHGVTPLMYACKYGHEKVLEMLITAKVNINVADKEGDTPLMYACRAGREKVVEILITTGADLNAIDKRGVSPLMYACRKGNEEVVKMLIRAGVDINAADKEGGETTLMSAFRYGNEKVVEMLIKAGVNINAVDKHGVTPLVYACRDGREKVVEMLITAGVDINPSYKEGGDTVLMSAIRYGNEKVVKMLIRAGVNINAADKHGVTPLVYACRDGREKVVEMLITAGVDISAADNHGVTPLMYACRYGRENVVNMLITAGVNIDTTDEQGVTSLMYAWRYGCEKVVEMLIRAGVNIHVVDKEGATPLIYAWRYGCEKVVEMLISAGVDIHVADKLGVTPLMHACIYDREKVMEMLIRAGVNTNATDKQGGTPLMYACRSGNEKLVEILITAGVDIHAVDRHGVTPLMNACKNGHEKVAEMLITVGVNLDVADNHGVTPLMYAWRYGCEKVVEMLITAGVNLDVADNHGVTPLMYAWRFGCKKDVEMLITAGVDINAADNHGITSLMCACRDNHKEVVEILITAGVDINAADREGVTPLMYACRDGHGKVVEMLTTAGVDIHVTDKQRVTPLMYACKYGHEKVVEMLIKAGVDLNVADNHGVTPLMYARRCGREKFMKMIL